MAVMLRPTIGIMTMSAQIGGFAFGAPMSTSSTWNWTLPPHFPSGKFLRVTIPSGTLSQKGAAIAKNSKGFFSVPLDAGSLTLMQ